MRLDRSERQGTHMSKNIAVNYIGRRGGGAVYAYEMTKSLVENGCNVYAIIPQDIDNIDKWRKLKLSKLILIQSYKTRLEFIKKTLVFKFLGVSELKKKFINVPLDAVYVPMIQPWSGMINSIFKNNQRIVTVHDPKPHSGSGRFFNWLCKNAARNADDIVVLSETFIEYSALRYKKERGHVHVIPHGIFNFYKDMEGLAPGIKYEPDKHNFLFFGRITKYKGLHILAEAYQMLSKEFDNITLTIVGNGKFEEYSDEFSRLSNVTVINRWIMDEEVGSFFKGSNIITVLPYTDASQSGVIPIAMEYQSLVIASDTGGLSEQVKDKETGYLFRSKDIQDLYQVMKYTIENENERDRILQNAYEYINTLSWDKLGAKLIEIIE